MNATWTRRARGFSLIEVMVSVIVICVGLLGIAKLQAVSLSNTNTSRMRALAAIEAASLAAAMHSNRQYWANAANLTVNYNAGALAASDANLTAALGVTNANACVNNQCGPAALAAFDLTRWSNSMIGLLPNPTGSISCPPAPVGTQAPPSCIIFITWTENAVAVSATNAAGGQYQVPNYKLFVEP